MARTYNISVPSEHTALLVSEFQQIEGFLGLQVQSGASIVPPGDVMELSLTDTGGLQVLKVLEKHNLLRKPGVSIITSEPVSIISVEHAEKIALMVSESAWEEMEVEIGKDTNINMNTVALMIIAGIASAVAIATNAVHVAIGAMIIAPGFAPLLRISLGLVAESPALRRGISHSLQGYAYLIGGAAVTAVVMLAIGLDPLGGEGSYLQPYALVNYWTNPSLPSILVSAAAAVAGAVLISTNRIVLTGGVMIALALIPTASLMGIALVAGDWQVLGLAALRWSIDVVLVILASLAVLGYKKKRLQDRKLAL
jgi:hypothetical protein